MAREYKRGYVRDDDDYLSVDIAAGQVELDLSDVAIGAVEIKDASSDQRAEVDSDGRLQVEDELLSAILALAGGFKVRDDYQTGEILTDQAGAGAVLTFTFSAAVQLVVIRTVGAGGTVRADPFGGTPTSTLGIQCPEDEPVYIPVNTSSVKVFAPVVTTVSVYGLRRA